MPAAPERSPGHAPRHPVLHCFITWIFRILFGGTFIFSGFVKGVDPWGTFYKFSEYFDALGLHLFPNLVLACAFALCALEFLTGFFIITGCYRRSAPVMGCIFMAVMLPLTLWIAVSDPVADCGCFGDALILSNWATFWKNVALTAMIIWLIRHNIDSRALITPALQWIGVVVSILYIGIVAAYGYFRQPLLDFRAYPVDSALIDNSGNEDEEEFTFVYEKDGETKEFGEEDELPSEEDGWVFVERKTKGGDSSGQGKHDKTFRIWDEQGNNDLTDSDIPDKGTQLILLIPDLASVSPATTWKINALYDFVSDNDSEMIAVVAAPFELIKEWEDLSMPEYEIYTAEDTAIKEVARGNPSVIFIEDGIIKWKTTLSSIDIDDLTDPTTGETLINKWRSGKETLLDYTYLYLIFVALLMAFSLIPDLGKIIGIGRKSTDRRRPKRDDKAPREG